MNNTDLMQITNVRLGTQIRKMRIMLEMTLTELAERASISKSYLSSIEANDKLPDMKVFIRICEGIGVQPHEILLKAYLENKNGVTESCWNNNYATIKKTISLIEQKLYPKEEDDPVLKEVKEALMTAT